MNYLVPKSDPFGRLETIMKEMLDFQSQFMSDPFFNTPKKVFKSSSALPKINIKEVKGGYIIEAAVPGYSKEDLRIYPDGNRLVISSKSNEANVAESDDGGYIFKELTSKGFSRVIPFPEQIDGKNIKAKLKDGFLMIEVPVVDRNDKEVKGFIVIE